MPLGLVQVFTGLVLMSLCTIAILVNILRVNYVVCLGLPFVISGSVAIAAYRRPSSSLIKGTLAMSVICTLLAAAGTGYFIWEISTQQRQEHCNERGGWNCSDMVWKFYDLRGGVLGLLLALSILELFVCIILSIFSGRAIQQDESDVDSYSSKSCLLKPGLDSTSNS
ncbi:membrane-spanning 4-domains subfamily A member 4A [Danio aesculapii]|uniref:membrane-spanning 4-domains subfamily A member 4A n=1 Tax=Danio aesculapii TaxID=1142201 RepID=UPI0024BF626A|nr:membrane-spanning 4-domains subfamily A member 4A [Danio aesculapii]